MNIDNRIKLALSWNFAIEGGDPLSTISMDFIEHDVDLQDMTHWNPRGAINLPSDDIMNIRKFFGWLRASPDLELYKKCPNIHIVTSTQESFKYHVRVDNPAVNSGKSLVFNYSPEIFIEEGEDIVPWPQLPYTSKVISTNLKVLTRHFSNITLISFNSMTVLNLAIYIFLRKYTGDSNYGKFLTEHPFRGTLELCGRWLLYSIPTKMIAAWLPLEGIGTLNIILGAANYSMLSTI